MDSSVTESRGTNWSNRFFYAGAFVLLAISAFLASLRTDPAGGVYWIGAIVGGALAGAAFALLVYGIARAFGKAKTAAGRARLAFWTMFVAFVLNLVPFAQGPSATRKAADTTITPAERRGLQVDSDSIRHAGFGFVLPHPGSGFSADPELQRQLDEGFSGQPGMAAWIFRDPALGQALMIQVAKLGPVNEAGFREYAAGMRKTGAQLKVLEDTLDWRDPAGEYRSTFLHPEGVYTAMRCLARVERSAIVCVMATAPQPNAIEASRSGLRFIM